MSDLPLTMTRVRELVRLGRYPHQSMLQPWSSNDSTALEAAMTGTNIGELRHRRLGSYRAGNCSGCGLPWYWRRKPM